LEKSIQVQKVLVKLDINFLLQKALGKIGDEIMEKDGQQEWTEAKQEFLHVQTLIALKQKHDNTRSLVADALTDPRKFEDPKKFKELNKLIF
jgi:hypothetical protein